MPKLLRDLYSDHSETLHSALGTTRFRSTNTDRLRLAGHLHSGNSGIGDSGPVNEHADPALR